MTTILNFGGACTDYFKLFKTMGDKLKLITDITSQYKCECNQPAAYLGFHSVRGSKFFWKSGGICMAQRKFFKMVRFREYFAKILQKNNLRNSHFLYKNNR